MKALILGAGYGTRLQNGLLKLSPALREKYEHLIKDKPKPLVPVAGKPLVEHLLEKIGRETSLQEVYIVTNAFFYPQFQIWQKEYSAASSSSLNIVLLNDGTQSNEGRLGVAGDLEFAVRRAGINEDLLVLAGDTLLEMDFGALLRFFYQKGQNIVSVYEEKDTSALSRRGIVVVNGEGKIEQFLEKPAQPPTNLAAPIAYVLTNETLTLLPKALHEGLNREGNIVEGLLKNNRSEFYAFRFEKRYDIGVIEDLIHADKSFSGRVQG